MTPDPYRSTLPEAALPFYDRMMSLLDEAHYGWVDSRGRPTRTYSGARERIFAAEQIAKVMTVQHGHAPDRLTHYALRLVNARHKAG